MTLSSPAQSPAYSYVGEELDLFSRAENWKQYFRSHLSPFIVGDVLEVGAGIGETTRRLCDGRQRSWTCIEPDPGLAGRLEAELAQRPLTPKPVVRVATTATLESSQGFNAILYIDVLEHIEHDRDELARAAALLAPGGALIVLSPAFNLLFSEFDRSVGHYRRYTTASLAAVMPPTLERARLCYLDSVGFMASLANRALLKQSLPTAAQVNLWDRVMVPLSRLVDPLVGRRFGRSVIGVYTRRGAGR